MLAIAAAVYFSASCATEPREPLVLRALAELVARVVPADLLRLARRGVELLHLLPRDHDVALAALEEHLRGCEVRDEVDGVDRAEEHLPFCVARGSRRIGAARHQDDRLDACVERSGEGGGLHAHAVADDPEPLRRDAVFLHEQVEAADEILDVADHQLARHRRQRLTGADLGLLRAAERRVDREHGDTALGEHRRLVDEVDPGAAGSVHEDDAGATLDPPLRHDDDAGDAVTPGARVRHPLDHDALLLHGLPFRGVERRLAIELEEPRGLLRDRVVLLRAGVAATAGPEEEQQQDQDGSPAHTA